MTKILLFLKKPPKKFLRGLEYSTLLLVVFYFTVLFFSGYDALGLEKPIIDIPKQVKEINEIVLGVMLGLLSFELLLKYIKIGDWKEFLKKNWLDISMVILIPIFAGIKILKTIKVVKKIKILKYGFKAADKTKKKIR